MDSRLPFSRDRVDAWCDGEGTAQTDMMLYDDSQYLPSPAAAEKTFQDIHAPKSSGALEVQSMRNTYIQERQLPTLHIIWPVTTCTKAPHRLGSASERFKASATPVLQAPVMLEGQVSREKGSAVE